MPKFFINCLVFDSIIATITHVEIPSDGRPIVTFTVTDSDNNVIVDIAASNVRFMMAKLTESPLGGFAGDWQSYINRIETPGAVGSGTEPRLQATQERGTNGTLTSETAGEYHYRFATDITNLNTNILTQAVIEGLDLSYDPSLTHRVSMQFSGGALSNPSYDWQPSTGATESIFRHQVVATSSCNQCHDPLAIHGGGRIDVDLCVTCHNPGSTDAHSGNSVDFKIMIHEVHRGASLPSVESGGEYTIYGYRNSAHNYSELHYPQDIRHCTTCHAGTQTDTGQQRVTDQGDNWALYPTRAACGACHDNIDFSTHKGGQSDDTQCASCHSASGHEASIIDAHTDPIQVAAHTFKAEILSIANTAPGDFPEITFQIVDPTNNNAPWDILNDDAWTQPNGASRLAIDISWDTTDYHNSGNGSDRASSVSINALSNATTTDNEKFTVTSHLAIPDGSTAPFVTASGSGAVAIEGHPALDLDNDDDTNPSRIPMTGVVAYFNIDETSGEAEARRRIVSLEKCQNCHANLSLHGANRNDSIELCVTCHNPRNTDRAVRPLVANPPVADGKSEESIDFKTMIHAIHAASIRTNPLYVVGYGGRVHTYDESTVHYPGDISNCLTCHENDTYTLPLSEGVLATTIDSGSDPQDPADDIVITPIAATCSACHDSRIAAAHMEANGAAFSATQAQLDNGSLIEQCALCHGDGSTADINSVHDTH